MANVDNTEELKQIKFFNPLAPHNVGVKISPSLMFKINQRDELIVLNHLELLIKNIAYKYQNMAAHAVGGSVQDIIQELNIMSITFFREWRENTLREGTMGNKTALDAVKCTSWMISRRIIDLSRYQRDKIHPTFQMWDNLDNADMTGKKNTKMSEEVTIQYLKTEWFNSLSDLQKEIVRIWVEHKLYNQNINLTKIQIENLTSEEFSAIKINPLIKKVRKILRIPVKVIVDAVQTMPNF